MKRRYAAVLAALLIAIAGGGSPAVASGKSSDDHSALQPCIDAAIAQRAPQWVCTPAGLTVAGRDAAGKASTTFQAMPTKVVDEGPVRTMADDYDTWCETGTTCNRFVDSAPHYIYEQKGNAAYGNQQGVIGSWDVVVRINLNGRQAQWRVTLIWDSGPTLDFNDVYITCWEEIAVWPDNVCGQHYAGGPVIGPGGWRWDSGYIYGNKLNNSNEYYSEFNALFTPQGHTTYSAGTLRSYSWICYNTDRCRF